LFFYIYIRLGRRRKRRRVFSRVEADGTTRKTTTAQNNPAGGGL
jgi:hypothetical protein